MRVAIEVNGHQLFRSIEGKVLYWGSTVESFNSGADKLMVPCVVLLLDDNSIECVSLKTDRTWTNLRMVEKRP